MRKFTALITILLAGIRTFPLLAQEPAGEVRLPENDQCIICHQEIEIMPEGFHANDIHMQEGLSCSGCHGGDPTSDDQEVAMSPAAGFVGVPSRTEIPQFCAKCHSDINFMRGYQPRIHTDQLDQYYTSVHGQRLKQGDKKVAECVNCHTAHAILPASDFRSPLHALNLPSTCNKCHGNESYMAEYKIGSDQYEKFSQSVHGVALLENQDTGAPACNDCHGNHGAKPPEITTIDQVCGNCHVNNLRFFSTTKMAREFEALEIHACAQCHGYHDIQPTHDDMVGTGSSSVCMDCHGSGEKGYAAADSIHNELTQTTTIYDSAQSMQHEVQRIGMDDVDIEFMLQEAHQDLIQARTLVHTFDPQKVAEKTEPGQQKAKEALNTARAAIKDYHVRRRGFGLATFFMLILIVAMWFKIREIEKKSGT